MRKIYEIHDTHHTVSLTKDKTGYLLSLDGKMSPCALEPLGNDQYALTYNGHRTICHMAASPDAIFVHLAGRAYRIDRIDPLEEAGQGAGGPRSDVAAAPMPGTVISVHASVGEAVQEGQTLMIVESMKLETTITAWRDGTIAEIHCAVGDTFPLKAPLVTLEPAGDAD